MRYVGSAHVADETEDTMPEITDAQIRQLADEAGWRGDYAQVLICLRALGEPVEDRRATADDHAVAAKFDTQEAARAECARVIADAEAQED